MYAIIVTGGKQYRVEQGDIVYIEKLDVEADSEVKFDQVLAIGEEGSVKVGAPVVEGASVSAKVIKNGKGKKLNIITYRAKKHSARRMGHRPVSYTHLDVYKRQDLQDLSAAAFCKRRRFFVFLRSVGARQKRTCFFYILQRLHRRIIGV